MLASGSLLEPQISIEVSPTRAWMSGALAGMVTSRDRHEGCWQWTSFLEDLKTRLEHTGITEPIWPGTNGVEGSHYDILGGYASTCGTADEAGLQFSIPTGLKEGILRLLSGIAVCRPDGHLLIPADMLDNFNRLVTIRGPLVHSMEMIM